jgi:NAD(P)H-binding
MAITVGVAGITGKFGTLVAQSLLQTPDIKLRCYCRNKSKVPALITNESRADIHDVNSLRKFVGGCNVVICAYLGDNEVMIEGQKGLVDACEAECVPRYIASDYCFDFTKLAYNEHPAKDPMKIIKEYVESKPNVKGVHLLIGAFMNTFWSQYFGVWDPQSEMLSYWGSGKEKWESTSLWNAAKFVTAVALDTKAVGLQKCECT